MLDEKFEEEKGSGSIESSVDSSEDRFLGAFLDKTVRIAGVKVTLDDDSVPDTFRPEPDSIGTSPTNPSAPSSAQSSQVQFIVLSLSQHSPLICGVISFACGCFSTQYFYHFFLE